MPTSSIRRAASAAVVAAAGVVTLLSVPAGAQTCYPPTAGCVTTSSSVARRPLTMQLNKTSVGRGETIQIVVDGFDPGSNGIDTIASVEQQIATFTVNAAGTATSSATIPTNIELGTHTIFARGTLGGSPASVSRVITVVAGGTADDNGSSNLARTGAVVAPTALVGVGLVAGGLVLKRSAKRKSSAKS